MHSAICAFDTRAQAQQAVDQLERAGFARHDLHIEHQGVGASLGHFFATLLGRDDPSSHADAYAQHVQRGAFVVVVDARDEAEAERASVLLHGLQGHDLNVIGRGEQRPLRDIVGERQAQGAAVNRSADTYEAAGSFASPNMERAQAAPHRISPTAGPDLREPETEHAPGLRYVDKDKPI